MSDTVADATPAVTHPLIEEMGDGFLVIRSTARILHLSALRSGLLADAGAAAKRVLIVTPPQTRLTFAMLQALRLFDGRWAVSAGDGLRLAGTDTLIAGPSEAWTAAAAAGERRRDGASAAWTQVTVSARYVDASAFEAGRVAEVVASETGTRLEGWGAIEPAASDWSPRGMTEWVRGRLPDVSRIVVHGSGASGTLRAWQAPSGIYEETKLVVRGAIPAEGAARLMRRLHGVAQIQFAFAVAMAGAEDLTFSADPPHAVEPRAALVGPRAVRDWAFPTAGLEAAGVLTRIGHPRTPSLLLQFGSGPAPAWADLETALRAFGPETVVSALAGETP
ncbi:DUF6177 family protein [Clavibacter sp. Sh2126]|uniref:DUF6177 family protein n=1 Tax=Clavibacter sp. Sh2126 TaxID=3397678 RepID=UPI0039E11A78